MELKLDYYFNQYQDNPIFKELIKDINNIWDINTNAQKYLNENIVKKGIKECRATLLGEVTFIGNYFIDEGTKIYPNVVMEGPVYIGKNVEIMPGAYIRPGSIIGDKCVVGFNAEIKNSVMQNGSKATSMVFVGDSILGRSARIGSGTILANRRFDQKNIILKLDDGTKLDTGTNMFGTIIGDNSRIGANSAVSPGTFIGPYSWVFPGTRLHGFVPAQKRVQNEGKLVFTDNERIELKDGYFLTKEYEWKKEENK